LHQGQWRMRVTKPGDTPGAGSRIWLNVVEMPHLDYPVPGSVRFRWTVADDGVWIPCGQSCCRGDGM